MSKRSVHELATIRAQRLQRQRPKLVVDLGIVIFVVFGVLSIFVLGFFLESNLDWIKDKYSLGTGDLNYSINIMLIHTALFKRVIAFFASLLLIFSGFSVSAYVLAKQAEVKFNIDKIGISLVTFSPGIIAMCLGVVVMVVSITSKDEFYFNAGSSSYNVTQPPPSALEVKQDLNSLDGEKK